MFGSYEICCEGRTYHGNVTLKEHRILRRGGNCVLFRVRDMAALPIRPELAAAIERTERSPDSLVPDELMGALRACGLVDEGGEEPESVAPAAETHDPAIPPVRSISLFLAQSCNMRCVYCYGGGEHGGGEYGAPGMMKTETALAAVDWLFDNSGSEKRLTIGFFGGEPLLNFEVMRHVVDHAKTQAAARGKTVSFTMNTNGSLLDEKIIAFIVRETVHTFVSFDGPPEVQNSQRPFRDGRASYDAVLAGIRLARESFPLRSARATVHGGNDPFAIRRGLEDAGFATCILSPVSPVIGEEAQAENEGMAARFLAYRRNEVERLFEAVGKRSLDAGTPSPPLALLSDLATGRKRHVACGAGRGMRAISATGDVYPCHRFVGREEFKFGGIGDYRAVSMNEYHRTVVDTMPVCRACWLRYLCGGGCLYHNRALAGDMRMPDPIRCREKAILCEDLVHGWCRLADDDREYVRNLATEMLPVEERA